MKTVGELIERNERNYPHNDAFVLDDRRVNYAEYARRSRQFADGLHRLGVLHQDRVGILSTNNIEYFEAYGACEWAGFILGLYNFRSAPPEVLHLVRDSAPRVVIFEAQFAALVDSLRAELKDVEHWICISGPGSAAPAWAIEYEAVVQSGSETGPPFRALPDDLAYIFYTSGTTGKPKGVPWGHTGALSSARHMGREMGPDSRLLQISPAFHTGGKGFPLGMLWMVGTVVLARSFDPLYFLQTLEKERITYTFVVAPMLQAILDHPRFKEFNVRSLRHVMAASAATPVPLLRRAIEAFGPVFFVAYGSTEGGNICTLERHEMRVNGSEADIKRLGSVGHFVPESDSVILDDHCKPVPQGTVGEICTKSPVFLRYWNNDVATLDATRGGYLHTGDLGYQDEEGFVYIVDRKKDMIISGGENIYSREVEEALSRHSSVAVAAVIGVPDAKWGESVKAFVILRPNAQATEEELLEHCRKEIARYKCPRSIELVKELPLLGSGKLDKVTLRKRHVQ